MSHRGGVATLVQTGRAGRPGQGEPMTTRDQAQVRPSGGRSGASGSARPLDVISQAFGCWEAAAGSGGAVDLRRGTLVGVPAVDRLWAGVGLTTLGRWVSGYPGTQGTTALAAAFAGLRHAERGEHVAPECFVATHGAFDAVRHALTVLPPSSPVAYAAPGFVMDIAVRRAGHQPVAVPWRLPEPVGVWLDRVEDLLVREGRRCGLVVNFPSNPAGSIAGRPDWERLLALVERHRALLVVDDVYGFLDPTTRPELSGRDDVVVVDSLSKRLGAPGLRLGYVMTSPANVAAVLASAATTSVGVSPLITQLGAAALSTYLADGLAGEVLGELARRRAAVRTALAPVGEVAVLQEHGFYGCLRVSGGQVDAAQTWLADRGLLLSAARLHDPHLRFCLGADPDVGEVLACLAQWPGLRETSPWQGPGGPAGPTPPAQPRPPLLAVPTGRT